MALMAIMMKLMAKTTIIIMVINISLRCFVSLYYTDPLYGYFD